MEMRFSVNLTVLLDLVAIENSDRLQWNHWYDTITLSYVLEAAAIFANLYAISSLINRRNIFVFFGLMFSQHFHVCFFVFSKMFVIIILEYRSRKYTYGFYFSPVTKLLQGNPHIFSPRF